MRKTFQCPSGVYKSAFTNIYGYTFDAELKVLLDTYPQELNKSALNYPGTFISHVADKAPWPPLNIFKMY